MTERAEQIAREIVAGLTGASKEWPQLNRAWLTQAILTALREAEAAGAAREFDALRKEANEAYRKSIDRLNRTTDAEMAADGHRSRQSPEGRLANQRAG